MARMKRGSNKIPNSKLAAKEETAKNFKSERGNSKTKGSDYKGKNGNDISWHAKSETLLTAAGAIPWSWSTGRQIPVISKYNGSTSGTILPGICALRTILMPGVGDKQTDAINIAAQALYTDIRRELKSANQYEGSDVMIYMLGVADVLAMISWLTRLYATTMLYSFENNYLPDALLRMQNVNPTDLHNRATEFRSRINQDIAKASQIWIPKGFDFITRARWIYSGYYSEGESIKDQIYMYTPGCFRKFVNLEESDYAGALEVFVPIPKYTSDDNAFTVDSLCEYFEAMIDALVGDSDFQNIAGDLFNRYGANGVETFTLIPEDAITYPMVSEEVLEQMMNARCLTAYQWIFDNIEDELKYFSINQDETNNVLVVPNELLIDISSLTGADLTNYQSRLATDAYEPILSIHKDPSPAKTMLVSRDTNVVLEMRDGDTTNTYKVKVDVASEIVVDIEYGIRSFNNGAFKVYNHASCVTGITASHIYRRTPFHYYPICYLAHTDAFGLCTMGGLDICAPISAEQLRDLNRVDLMSLFAVPDVGKVNK